MVSISQKGARGRKFLKILILAAVVIGVYFTIKIYWVKTIHPWLNKIWHSLTGGKPLGMDCIKDYGPCSIYMKKENGCLNCNQTPLTKGLPQPPQGWPPEYQSKQNGEVIYCVDDSDCTYAAQYCDQTLTKPACNYFSCPACQTPRGSYCQVVCKPPQTDNDTRQCMLEKMACAWESTMVETDGEPGVLSAATQEPAWTTSPNYCIDTCYTPSTTGGICMRQGKAVIVDGQVAQCQRTCTGSTSPKTCVTDEDCDTNTTCGKPDCSYLDSAAGLTTCLPCVLKETCSPDPTLIV